MSVSTPAGEADAAGLLQIRIAADNPTAAAAVAALAAGIVKGALPGGASDSYDACCIAVLLNSALWNCNVPILDLGRTAGHEEATILSFMSSIQGRQLWTIDANGSAGAVDHGTSKRGLSSLKPFY